jgi:hypothetical protein
MTAATTEHPNLYARWMRAGSRSRRLVLAAALYLIASVVYAAVAGPPRLVEHTQYNHYALLADAWLHGRWDIAGGPPSYALNNDFVSYEGKTFISFPPLPAMLMLPFVKLSGGAEGFRDGQFIVWLAGIAPAVLFLVLEKLSRTGRSRRSERENLLLAALFAFGSVYFFTAVEGTVWFAAMVVATGVSALCALFALDAEQPVLAGAMIGCAYLSRPPAVWMALLFAYEAARVSMDGGLPTEGTPWQRLRTAIERLDARALLKKVALFSAPILVTGAFVAWMNHARYGRPTPIYFDHELLSVAWRGRMSKWGMLNYHYLGKNLGIALTSLPWLAPRGEAAAFGAPFKINEHGLALWFTSPFYLWLLWPKRQDGDPGRRWLLVAVACAAGLSALMDLLYQNSGWRQFGYRFSNDYAVLLFVLLAVGGRSLRGLFAIAAAWAIAWNTFGAITFDKAVFDRFYFRDGSQTIVYQPD